MVKKVFICYSHKDEKWKDDLRAHLGVLEKSGRIVVWDDRDIDGGDKWYDEIMAAMEDAAVAVCLVSSDFLNSDFIYKEEVPHLLKRRRDEGMVLLPVLVRPCLWDQVDWIEETQMLPRDGASISADFAGNEDTPLKEVASRICEIIDTPDYAPPAPVESEWAELDARYVDIERLPRTGKDIFGRKQELELVSGAWEAEETHIVSLVAWGGVGKSALVNKWVRMMGEGNYRGAQRVFAWSFYSQGTGERVTSADMFVHDALVWFGDSKMAESKASPWDKGKRLAELVQEKKTLLILDGMEPLQSGYEHDKGEVKDAALSVLLNELAKKNPGLCVITTRLELTGISRGAVSILQKGLDQISPEAGRALLRVAGIRGTDAELEQATEDFGCHALAVKLLATYLQGEPGQHVGAASSIGEPDLSKEEKHPRRVMEAFAKRLGEGPELNILHMMGLFDRPASAKEIKWLRTRPAVPHLTDHIYMIPEVKWNAAISHLRLLGLLAPQSHHELEFRGKILIAHEKEEDIGALDAHPVVRTHFGQRLRKCSEESWKAGHSHLYEYLGLSARPLPETLEEMKPLFLAVGHGCQAGRYQEAFDDVYFRRIIKGKEYYVVHKLGAFGACLAVLSGFFGKTWSQPVSELSEAIQALNLSQAGYALRALGRSREAVEPFASAMARTIEQKDWMNSATNAGNLSTLYLTLGNVQAAVDYGQQSVEYADKSGSSSGQCDSRAGLGDALHQAGAVTEARGLLEEAEGMQKKIQAGFHFLYSVRGSKFCALILSGGGYEEVKKRARQTLEWVRNKPDAPLLTVAVDYLSLGRAYLLEAITEGGGRTTDDGRREIMAKAGDWLGQAVDGLREAGTQDHIPRGLLGRAEYYRYGGKYGKAWRDLGEAWEVAERGEMGLHLADCCLEASRLVCRMWDTQGTGVGCRGGGRMSIVPFGGYELVEMGGGEILGEARKYFEEARREVDRMGYHRRDPEVLLIEAEILVLEGKEDKGKKVLDKAKARIDEMGFHRWDSEVKRISNIES